MTCSIGRLPTAEPIESKLVNMLWPNDNIVAAPVNRDKNVALPAKGLKRISWLFWISVSVSVICTKKHVWAISRQLVYIAD